MSTHGNLLCNTGLLQQEADIFYSGFFRVNIMIDDAQTSLNLLSLIDRCSAVVAIHVI